MGDKASDTNLVDFADVKRYAALLLDGSSNNCSNNCADFERGGILPFFGLPTLQNKCEAGRLLLSVLRKEDKTSDTNLVDSAFVKMYALLPLDCSSNNCSDLDLGGNLTFDCLPTQQNNCERGEQLLSALPKTEKASGDNFVDSVTVPTIDCGFTDCANNTRGGNQPFECLLTLQTQCEPDRLRLAVLYEGKASGSNEADTTLKMHKAERCL